MPVAPLEIYEQLLSHMLQTSRRNVILYLKNTQTQSTLIWRSNVSLKIKDNQVSENLTNINTHTLFLLPIFFLPPTNSFLKKNTKPSKRWSSPNKHRPMSWPVGHLRVVRHGSHIHQTVDLSFGTEQLLDENRRRNRDRWLALVVVRNR